MISPLSLIILWKSQCLYIIFHNSWSHQLFRQAFRRNSLKTSFSDRNSNCNSLSTPMVFFSLFGWNYVQKYIIYKNSWKIQMEIPSEIQMFFLLFNSRKFEPVFEFWIPHVIEIDKNMIKTGFKSSIYSPMSHDH